MGRPTTLLEGLGGHALSLGAQSIEVEYKNGRELVFANKGGIRIGIANYTSSSADAKELRGNLYAAAKKPVRTVGCKILKTHDGHARLGAGGFWRAILENKQDRGESRRPEGPTKHAVPTSAIP